MDAGSSDLCGVEACGVDQRELLVTGRLETRFGR